MKQQEGGRPNMEQSVIEDASTVEMLRLQIC
jgi:hypothetical protein